MPRLIVEKGHEKGKSIPLLAKATMVFGRDTAANVQIKDTMASRQHFKIEPRADGLWIVELQSMNGTLLNGHPVKEAKLNPGDLIRVGETMYSFLVDDAGTDPLIGQRLGGYKILERVGRGGMGTVYKAEQVDLQRIVALKIISEEHLKNQEFIELFVHEARAAAKLNHTNIVQVYDVKKANELYYFSMEFVPGGSVQDLLNNRRKLPISDTVRMILEAARGLEYAHRKEIIHRDVKPDNFMIGEGGAIKIGDLGLAQRLGEKLAADNDNTVIGTPHYIAPEQVLGRPADVRSDVYSLGSTMYRMIAGFTPFQAPSVRDLVNKKAREDAVPLHSALEGIPESLSKICAKMMERLPENRTQSMTEVIAELEGWTRADGRDEVRESHPLNRKLLLSAVGLLAVVVIGGVIAAGAMLKTPPPTTPGPETGTTTAVDDSASAELKFDRAALEESRLVDQKPDAFDDVIKQYDAIVARWPDSAWGKDAERRRAALKERRLGIMAARGLSQLEDLDREGWKNLVQGFQAGREDLSEAGRRVQEFRAFADDPSWKGTDAAITAGRRAEAITAWLAEAEKRRSAYEALKVKSDKLSSEQRFREAWEACNEFIAEIAAYAPQAKDRYTTLLFDLPARRLQQSIVEQGTKSLEEAAKTAAALEAKGEYANAVATLELHARNSIKEASDHARKLMEEIHQRWSAANKAAAEKATLEQKKLADLDRRDFDATALRWREFVLKLDPKSALSESQGLSRTTPDRFPRFPATEARIITRVAALRTLADFKNLFLKAVNEKSPSIPLKISIERQSGTLVKASETHLTVALSAGQIETSFADILDDGPGSASVAQFLDYLRSAGKNVDPKWGMGVVILCFELGLYERALEDIRPLEKSADETVRRFVAEFKPLAEELKYIDSDEIEAQKHFERLTLALKDPPAAPRFDIGRTLQLLRNRFGETDFVLAQKSKLDEIEKDRVDRDVRDKEKTIRAERYRKILAARARAQGNSKARENEITRALAGLKDPIEGLYNLGESKLGFGDAKEATRLHLSAYDQVMRKFPTPERRGPGEPMMLWAARLGGALMRDFHLQKQESRAADIRNKIDAKYDEGMEYEPWKWIKDAHDDWAAQATDKARKLAAAEKELQENPDAKSLYDLAEAHDVLRNALEARGLYSALREEFPDFDKVKNGDALLRLAEMTWQLRDVTTALDLYSKMKTDHATHPKVVQSGAWDSVDNRIKACTTLKNQMGPLK